MAPYKALYRRSCQSSFCWTKVGKRTSTGPDLVRDTSEKVELIQKRLVMAQSRKKNYDDRRQTTTTSRV